MTEQKTVEMVETQEGTFVPETKEVTTEKATHLFNTYTQIGAVKKMREEIKSQQLSVLGDDDAATKLSEMIAALSVEDIRELTDEAIEEIYNLDGTGSIEISLDLKGKREVEFKRDFLVYMKESETANAALDQQLDAMEKELDEHQAQFKELVGEFGDLSTYMRTKLQDEYDAAEGPKKEKLAGVIEAYDDATTLNRVIEHYQNYSTGNTITDYFGRAEVVFKKYVKVIEKLHFHTDLTDFNNLETNLLEEKYHKYPNLFIFSIIKMYAYKKDATRTEDGVFLSQLAVNLKSLYADTFATEEKKEQFKDSIRKVLDLFLGE
jgi:hypothetical protein